MFFLKKKVAWQTNVFQLWWRSFNKQKFWTRGERNGTQEKQKLDKESNKMSSGSSSVHLQKSGLPQVNILWKTKLLT